MFTLFMFSLMILMLFIIAMKILPIINIHKKLDREKNSPFECGFDPFSKTRNSFSIHFFSICLMFLIFDIEITLLLPTALMMNSMKTSNWLISTLFIFIILLLGLIIEWKEGSMEWK